MAVLKAQSAGEMQQEPHELCAGVMVLVRVRGEKGWLVIIHRLIFQFPWIKAVYVCNGSYIREIGCLDSKFCVPKAQSLGGDSGWSKIMELFSISMVDPRPSSANARGRKHSPPNMKVS